MRLDLPRMTQKNLTNDNAIGIGYSKTILHLEAAGIHVAGED
jgi:hypothetical protein